MLRLGMQKSLVVLQVERLGDAAEQSGTGENCDLSIEVSWILKRSVQKNRVAF